MGDNNNLIIFSVVALLIGAGVGTGIGYFLWNTEDSSGEQDYNFYLYFGASDTRNGWYTASGTDTNAAFDKAMDNAGFEYTVAGGYISTIDEVGAGAGWYLCQYLYDNYTAAAATGSVAYPEVSYGTLTYSNGWKSMSGYDDSSIDFKLSEFTSTTYFFSVYAADWSAASPVSTIDSTDWDTTGPFAA